MNLQARLKQQFEYVDGQLIYKAAPKYHAELLNKVAGSFNKEGYRTVQIEGKKYKTHQLVWLYFNGKLPQFIDHINHNRSDNRIENLREVKRGENNLNTGMYKTNKSGYKGVYLFRDRGGRTYWRVDIQHNRRSYTRLFSNKTQAITYSLELYTKLGFHPNHFDPQSQVE